MILQIKLFAINAAIKETVREVKEFIPMHHVANPLSIKVQPLRSDE